MLAKKQIAQEALCYYKSLPQNQGSYREASVFQAIIDALPDEPDFSPLATEMAKHLRRQDACYKDSWINNWEAKAIIAERTKLVTKLDALEKKI